MRRLTAFLFALAFLRCATATQGATGHTPADIVVTHATLVTMAGSNIDDGAIAIRDGAIVDIGRTPDIASHWSARETIDATGMAVVPGFVNAHTHAPMTLFRGIADDRTLMDWLRNYIFPAEAKNVDAEFVKWGTRLAAAEMIRSGTTTFADMYYFEADIAREARAAGMRAVAGETMIDFPAPDNKTWDEAVAYVRKFVDEFRGDKLIIPALAPHAPYTVSKEHLQQVRALANELHVPILIHLAETTDETKQIREKYGFPSPTGYLQSIGFLGDDVVAAHGIWLSENDIADLVRTKTGIAHCPESNMMLASGIAPVVELRKAGVEVGLGTDGPAGSNDNLDMIEEMASAARLQKIARKDPQALSAHDVLEMATIGGAKVLGIADRVGSLEKGKRADIAIIDLREVETEPHYSVESAIVYAASGSKVDTTIIDGRVVMRHRQLLTIDLPSVLAKAREYRQRIEASLGK